MDMFKGSHFGSRGRRPQLKGPQLQRSTASNNISYDSAGSRSRGRPQQTHEDEPEFEDLGEFSIHGKGDIEEMSNVFRYLGLPAPGNIGITRESWEVVKQSPSGSPLEGVWNHSSRSLETPRSLSLPSESDLKHPSQPILANESHGTAPQGDAETSKGGERPFEFKVAPAQSSQLQRDGNRAVTAPPALMKSSSSSAIPDPPSNVGRKDGPGNAAQEPATVVERTVAPTQGNVSVATELLDRKEEKHPAQPQANLPGDPGLADVRQPTAPAGNPVDRTQAASSFRNRDSLMKSLRGGSQSGSLVLKAPPPMKVARFSQAQNTMALVESLAPDSKELSEAFGAASSDDEDNDTMSESGEETSEQVSEAVHPVSDGEPEQRAHSGEQTSNGEGTESAATAAVDAATNAVQVDEDLRVLTVKLPRAETEKIELDEVGQKVQMEEPVVAPDPFYERPVGPHLPWMKGQHLGAGSFGTVFEAVDRDGLFFAVKEVSMTESDKKAQDAIAQLMQEIELLSSFRHPNIVQYMGTQKADGKLYIFLELVAKGSLADICRRLPLSDSQISAYTRQILKGLKYLHDRKVVHRDIKCANILVDTLGICKLADFGMAKQISTLDQMKSAKGSAYWMAPEVINPKQSSSFPADIWSLGCSVLEMATRAPPFGEVEWYRVMWIVGHGTAPPIPDTLPESAQDFIKQCLDINPMKRPTATQLLDHPFVRQAGGLTPTNSGPVYYTPPAQDMSTIKEEQSGEYSSQGSASGTPHANGNMSSSRST